MEETHSDDKKLSPGASHPPLSESEGNFTVPKAVTNCSHRRAAFTLAEVLITLAVIGVVAVLTIPNLVQNYQERAWATAATVFEHNLEQALRVMNTQGVLAGNKTTENFLDELSKHFKITKICPVIEDCIEDEITWNVLNISSNMDSENLKISEYVTAADLGKDNWDTNAIGVQFANGTSAIIAYNPNCTQEPYNNQYSGINSCISMIYDTSGYKNPNTVLKDVRGINSKIKNCAFRSNSTCFSTPFTPDRLSQSECEKIKGVLGIDCLTNSDSDSWGGAVKTCGSINNMPTRAQLYEIANYLYGRSDLNTGSWVENLSMDKDKAVKLGFITNTKQGLGAIWAKEHPNAIQAYYVQFNDNLVRDPYNYRSMGAKAVCITN